MDLTTPTEETKQLVRCKPFEVKSSDFDDDDESGDILFDDEVNKDFILVATNIPPQYRRTVFIIVSLMAIFCSVAVVMLWTSNNENDTDKTVTLSATVTEESSSLTPSMSPTVAITLSAAVTEESSSLTPSMSPTVATTLEPSQSLTSSPTTESSTIKYYSIARTDRAGSAIKEMYLAHSFAFATNKTYGGACVDAIDWDKLIQKHGEKFKGKVAERVEERKQLITLLGLENELPMACPTKQEIKEGNAVIWKSRNKFKKPGFTAKWMDYIQSRTTFPYVPRPTANNTDEPVQIVVHLRRGDFTPCHVADRYLPNIYYSRALDAYLPQYCAGIRPCNVTIFTEADAYEPLDEFQQRNFTTVDVTATPPTIWKDIINADVFIMSMSAFSFIPAVVNKNKNIITPYSDIPHWKTINNEIWLEAWRKRNELVKQCPPK